MSDTATNNIVFDGKQRDAISRCIDISPRNRIVPVSGPAGTGKTTLLETVYYSLRDAGYRVVLCAPTGKAAKRIQEVTGIPAMTQHRMLEYPHPGERDAKTGKALRTTDPKRHRFNRLPYDVVLADEYAMVTAEVHRNIVDALPDSGCLRAFGDVNQLAPVEKNRKLRGKPSPFMEIIKMFQGVELDQIHRQAEGSSIIANSGLILRGLIPRRYEDYLLSFTTKPVHVLCDYIFDSEERFGISYATNDAQIITPTRKNWTGTAALNTKLQLMYQPDAATIGFKVPRHTWALDKTTYITIGDKVIWTENDYNLPWCTADGGPCLDEAGNDMVGCFNGETGIIHAIDRDVEEFIINLGDRYVRVPPIIVYQSAYGEKSYDPRRSVDLAYAVTTHKAQGSEYKHVTYVLNKSSMFVQNRRNIYTGTSRPRDLCHIITDQQSISASLRKRE